MTRKNSIFSALGVSRAKAADEELEKLMSRSERSEASSRDQLEDELAEIDKKYDDGETGSGNKLPETEKYDRMEYDAPSDEEIKTKAESELEKERLEGIEKIESENAASKADKELEAEEVAARAEKLKRETNAAYDEVADEFSNDALRRGLARSSVAVNGKSAIESARAAALTQAATDADKEAAAIEKEIAALEEGRRKALDAFDIAHAAKVTERIAQLTEEREKKIAETLKYNNELLKQEQKDLNDRAELESDLKTDELRRKKLEQEVGESSDGAAAERAEAKYNAVRNYLLGMSKSDAAYAIRNDDLVRDSLSDKYYFKLYNEFCK